MKAFLYAKPGQAHQLEAMSVLSAGLRGCSVTLGDDWSQCDGDFVVCWGDKVPQQFHDRPRLILEAGYINGQSGDYVSDRLRFISAGWNGLHGRADPMRPDCPPDRWQKVGADLDAWQNPTGKPFLICDQHPGDSASPRSKTWWKEAEHAAKRHEAPIRYRPHPLLSPNQKPLGDVLHEVGVLVTWSSTAAIEAVLRGVPTVALDNGSPAWDVTSHGFHEKLYLGPRQQWAYNLAYRQWTPAELASGEAWEYLRQYMM